MNLDKALDKEFEKISFPDIVELPPSSLQGLADRVDEPLKQIGIHNVAELGSWIFYQRAKGIVTLAATETSDGRASDSAMNLEGVVPKKFARKHLSELADMPVSTLQGVTAKQAQILDSTLHVKTIRDLAQNKFLAWADSIATLSDVKTGKEPATPVVGTMVVAGEPHTPYRTPGQQLTVHKPASPVNTYQAMTLQLEDYKVSMTSLNDRLKHYIDLIRERDETITELNAEKHMLKTVHIREVKELDTSYLVRLQELELKVNQLHQKEILELEQQVKAAKMQKEKEAKKIADMSASYKQMQKQYESMKVDLHQYAAESLELKKAADDNKKLTDGLEAQAAMLLKENNVLEKNVQFVKGQSDVHIFALGHAEEAKKVALDELNKQHFQQHKKQREELLLQIGQERDAQKKKILAETTGERLVLVEKQTEVRELLENDLRKLNMVLADTEQKYETTSRELNSVRTLYGDIKTRYDRECSSQKIRIAELTSDMTTANKQSSAMQSDFNKFVGESRTIVKEIDRYNSLMTAEESRLGLVTPGSVSAKAKTLKRRRMDDVAAGSDDDVAPTDGTPGTGLMGTIKRLVGRE